MSYRLLDTFRSTFEGKPYLHRRSALGDLVAMHLYEDLYSLGKSPFFKERVDRQVSVLNQENRRHGIKARRGDGTFGELIPNVTAVQETGYTVSRGPVATVEIGVEVKILAKAMIKQIDRVIGDLQKQVSQFRKSSGNPICLGLVGINHAQVTTGYEGDRTFTTDGKKHKHPFQEAHEAEKRLVELAKPSFDEFLVLRYRASNVAPFPFEWVDLPATDLDYGAILTRISREYDRRLK